MASASAALPVNVSASRTIETKSAAADVAEQPFDRVFAQEVSRREEGGAAGESGARESAQAESAPPAETESVSDNQDAELPAQNVAVVPWLLMMQQVTQPAQVTQSTAILTEGATVTQPAGQGQGASAVSQVPTSVLAGSEEDAATGALAAAGGRGEALTTSLAANSTIESGKSLPQAVSSAMEKTSFAGMLASRLGGDGETLQSDDSAKVPSWMASAQTMVYQPEVGGAQASKVVAQHVVAEPVSDARWGDAVAQRVSMMLGRQEQQVDMQLNPPHLGPMEVRLTLGQEQASVVFASQHAAVREALEAATPKLTALLADQGIQLVNVQVASDSLHQQAQEQSRQQQASSFSGGDRGQRNGSAYEPESSAPNWIGDVTVPVARSGVSLYV